MAKYRKKPVVIEAVQFEGDNLDAIIEFTEGEAEWQPFGVLVIQTLEGDMTAEEGDWIIKGVQGEFYPCKPDIFTTTYEEAENKGATTFSMSFDHEIAKTKTRQELRDVCREMAAGLAHDLYKHLIEELNINE